MTRTAISPRLAMRTFLSTLRLSNRSGLGQPVARHRGVTCSPRGPVQHWPRPVGCVPCRDPRFTDVRRFDSIDSTNRYLLDEARPGPPRAWWRWPTTRRPAGAGWAGAGRRRPGSNLLVSVLLRPDLPAEQRHLASAVVALAARRRRRPAASGVVPADQVAERPAGRGRAEAGRGPGRGRPGRRTGPERRPRSWSGSGSTSTGRPPTTTSRPSWPGSATSLRQQVGAAGRPGRAARRAARRPSGPGPADLGRRRAGPARPTISGAVRHRRDRGCGSSWPDGRFEGTAIDITAEGHLVVDVGGRRRTVVAGDVVHVRPGVRTGARTRAGLTRALFTDPGFGAARTSVSGHD